MKRRIHKYDKENGIITTITNNRYLNFYLTNSIKRRFEDLLEVGSYIEFKPDFKRLKIIGKIKCYRINHFITILKPSYLSTKVIYDINNVRKNIISAITLNKYYLFLDLEMTMPPYYQVEDFEAEIIQVGYYLTDQDLNIIKKNDYYLKPTKFKTVSKRTLKFLNIERGSIEDSKPYSYFYEDLQQILNMYKPKVVVWGKNDYLAIKTSFKLNKEKPIIDQKGFINLLSNLKQYYNLFDDVGLFKAYEIYYNETPVQEHNALSDAFILYKIYEAFTKSNNSMRAFSKLR